MRKQIEEIKIDYIYDTNHKRANYSFDGGQHWRNGGEFAEIITKSVLGFVPEKDPNTGYDEASDIEEVNASVKSSAFTLVNKVLADNFEETVDRYFETVHSDKWIFTVVMENVATLYWMDADEFRRFIYQFCYFNERKCVRCRAISGKMVRWLEERAS